MSEQFLFPSQNEALSETRIGVSSLRQVIEAARRHGPELREQLLLQMGTLDVEGTSAVPLYDRPPIGATSTGHTLSVMSIAVVWGQKCLFAISAKKPTQVSVDGGEILEMKRIPDSNLWYRLSPVRVGRTHVYTFYIEGKEVGTSSVAGYNPDSYPPPGAPRGDQSDVRTVESHAYPGTKTSYWIYANHGIDEVKGAPMMLWQDGHKCVDAFDLRTWRLQIVTDNLVYRGLIPPMVHVLVTPGDRGDIPMAFPHWGNDYHTRSLQYDTVSPRYGQYLIEEILPEVEREVKLRADAYSRGAAGESSGAICSFNLAWYHPEKFSRVLSTIGSYTGLQTTNDYQNLGGDLVASMVRREAKRNMRIWLSDGMNDIDADSLDPLGLYEAGSWPLNNIMLANALKTKGYDFHFRYSDDVHGSAQGALDLPESLAWLWRDYDSGKTAQDFEQERTEQAKPIYRVQIANRDAW